MHDENLTSTEPTEQAERDETQQPAGTEKKPFVPPTITEPVSVFQATHFFQLDTLGGGDV